MTDTLRGKQALSERRTGTSERGDTDLGGRDGDPEREGGE